MSEDELVAEREAIWKLCHAYIWYGYKPPLEDELMCAALTALERKARVLGRRDALLECVESGHIAFDDVRLAESEAASQRRDCRAYALAIIREIVAPLCEHHEVDECNGEHCRHVEAVLEAIAELELTG